MRFTRHTIPNALKAAFRIVRSWFRPEELVLATDYVRAVRLARCRLCPHNDAVHYTNPSGQCRLCTCYIDLKTYFATESCPDNPPRWKQQTRTSKGL